MTTASKPHLGPRDHVTGGLHPLHPPLKTNTFKGTEVVRKGHSAVTAAHREWRHVAVRLATPDSFSFVSSLAGCPLCYRLDSLAETK